MKASELIYRLARAIEERGDLHVTVACEDGNGFIHEKLELKSLDANTNAEYFEIYGE